MSFDWIVFINESSQGDELAIFASIANGFSNQISLLTIISNDPKAHDFAFALMNSTILSGVTKQHLDSSLNNKLGRTIELALSNGSNPRTILSQFPSAVAPERLVQFLANASNFERGISFCTPNPDDLFFNPLGVSHVELRRSLSESINTRQLENKTNFAEICLDLAKELIIEQSNSQNDAPSHAPAEHAQVFQRRFIDVMPTLSVVVPTLDVTSARCTRLVNSLREYTSVPYQIILVDNGNAPQGFSTPVNTAIRGCNTDYIAVINDDVEVDDNWWMPLQKKLDQGAQVVFPRTKQGTRLDFSAWCFAMTKGSVARLSVSTESFYNEALKIWYQDTDLLLRMKLQGIRPEFVPESTISHGFSETLRTPDIVLSAWINRTIDRDRETFNTYWQNISETPGKLSLDFLEPTPQ